MTPTTPEQARDLARDAALDFGCIRRAIGSLADQVEALTKERDFLAMANKDLSEAMARYQQVQEAAKLALFQMERTQYLVRSGAPRISAEKFHEAITTLRRAGIQ